MSFQPDKLRAYASHVVATQRLFRTNDGRLVEDGDPDAAFLFCTPGRDIPLAEAMKYGLVESDPAPDPVEDVPDEDDENLELKESRPGETKELQPGETKRKKKK